MVKDLTIGPKKPIGPEAHLVRLLYKLAQAGRNKDLSTINKLIKGRDRSADPASQCREVLKEFYSTSDAAADVNKVRNPYLAY